jgi:hypothetical protein
MVRNSGYGLLAVVAAVLLPIDLALAQTFTTATWTISNPLAGGQPQIPGGLASTLTQPIAPRSCPITDTGGSGLPGYICPYVTNGSADTGFVYATNPSGSGFSQSGLTGGVPSQIDYYAPFPGCYSGNFDGNGKRSVVCIVVSGAYHYANGQTSADVAAINYLTWYHAPVGGQAAFSQVINATNVPFPGTTVMQQGTAFSGSSTATDGSNTSIDGCIVADFNGDGRDDLACGLLYSPTQPRNSDTVYPSYEIGAYIYMSTSTGFVERPLVLGSTSPAFLQYCLSGDFNGDGLADFACAAGTTWNIFYSEGTGTTPHFAMVSGAGPTASLPQWKTGDNDPQFFSDDCLTGDFNGDGRTDIACYASSGQWSVGLATGDTASTFNVQTWAGGPAPLTSKPHTPGGDCWGTSLDGAAIGGILCYAGSGSQWNYGKWTTTGSSFSTKAVTTSFTPPTDQPPGVIVYSGGKNTYISGITVTGFCALADFNGDNLPDVACSTTNSNATALLLSVRPQ